MFSPPRVIPSRGHVIARAAIAVADASLPFPRSPSQIGGVSGSIAKTATAPIERVKLLIQTQDANPKVRDASRP